MRAFWITRGGYRAMATLDECELLCGLIQDIVYILGADAEDELARARAANSALALDSTAPESDLAALEADFFVQLEDEFAAIEERVEAEMLDRTFLLDHAPAQQDDALERLLPDMSEDPEVATELRALTEESITLAKINHLMQVYQELQAVMYTACAEVGGDPADFARLDNSLVQQQKMRAEWEGRAGAQDLIKSHFDIFVSNEAVMHWLAAMNDIRLVLATRLEIGDSEINDSVYERAQLFTSHSMTNTDNLPEVESPEDMMTVLYTMISWWQESLLYAVRNKSLRK